MKYAQRVADLLAARGYREIPLNIASGKVSVVHAKPALTGDEIKEIAERTFAKGSDQISLRATRFTGNKGAPFEIEIGVFIAAPAGK
jgi:hypothetical protein